MQFDELLVSSHNRLYQIRCSLHVYRSTFRQIGPTKAAHASKVTAAHFY